MRIAHFGTFDVANYGDLLFPLIAEKRLQTLQGVSVERVSPIGARPTWPDSVNSIGFEAFVERREAFDGILIGGGNIIHLTVTDLPDYDLNVVPLLGYANLWVGATATVAPGPTPICWNAPGVPKRFPRSLHSIVRQCVERGDYISVRDEISRERLLEACPDADIVVVPDTAWEIDQLWDGNALRSAHEAVFIRYSQNRPQRSLAIHVNSRYLGDVGYEAVARRLDELCRRFDARGLLLAIGPCHGDDKLARQVGEAMTTHPIVIDRPAGLQEIATCIAHAIAYVGSSMHGFITATAFGVPGMCIASGGVSKFPGLFASLALPHAWSETWNSVPEQLLDIDLNVRREELKRIRKGVQSRLDAHWEDIIRMMGGRAQRRTLRDSDAAITPQSSYGSLGVYSGELLQAIALEQFRAHQHEKEKRREWEDCSRRFGEEVASLRSDLVHRELEVSALRNDVTARESEVASVRNDLVQLRRELSSAREKLPVALSWSSRKMTASLRAASAVVRGLPLSLTRRWRAASYMLPRLAKRHPRESMHLVRAFLTLRGSKHFDAGYYLSRNRDVAAAGVDPLMHYLFRGAFEGRDPNPRFSSACYLRRNPEVAAAGINPLMHHLDRAQRSATAGESGLVASPARTASTPTGGGRWRERGDMVATHAVGYLGDLGVVTVLVPIYNAFSDVRRCIESVIRHTSRSAELLLIDDASTDPRIGRYLASLGDCGGIRVLQNEQNVGFVRAVNRGFQEARGDVVVLNSDTEVGPRWLENLAAAAYSDPRVATATALTDNGGAFAVPEVGQDNRLPENLSAAEVARLVSQASQRRYPVTPTGNAFCVYVKRAALDSVGGFDAERFPRGYGEENEFCMRARAAGWTHVVDDATFVRHTRGASFGPEKDALMRAGRAVVDGLYPEYTALVREFVRSEEMERVRAGIRQAFGVAASVPMVGPRVLFVIHEGMGGTPQTNADLMGALAPQYQCFVLTSDTRTLKLSRVVGEQLVGIEAVTLETPLRFGELSRPDYREFVSRVLLDHAIELVHVRHLIKHTFDAPDVAAHVGIPVVVSVHDYYLSCPTVHLLDDQDRFCGGVCTPGQGSCRIPTSWVQPPHLKHGWVHTWRREVGRLFRRVDAFVTTSPTAREIYRGSYPFLSGKRFEVIEHGCDLPQHAAAERSVAGGPVRILVPGNLDVHKGSEFIRTLKGHDADGRLELHFMGRVPAALEALGTSHGIYRREEFAARVAEIRPAFIGLFSITAETYAHTLTEAWSAGVPVLASAIGALKERVEAHGGGWLIDWRDPAAALARILEIADDPGGYRQVASQASVEGLPTVTDMAAAYGDLYAEVLRNRQRIRSSNRASKLSGRLLTMDMFVVCGRDGHPVGSAHVRSLRRLQHPVMADRLSARIADIEEFLARPGRDVDLVYVQRTAIPPVRTQEFLDTCRNRGHRLVVDLDDHLLDLGHRLDLHVDFGEHVEPLRALLGAADLVTVSTETLRIAMAVHARRVALVPNQIDEHLWFGPRDSTLSGQVAEPHAGDVQILYMGTATHAGDLALLQPALKVLRERLDAAVRLVVVGGEPSGPGQEWYERLVPPRGASRYPRFVQWLRAQRPRFQLAVAPLEDTPFNSCKSDLKFLEYSALGLPAVYSRTVPYAGTVEDGVTGLLAGPTPEEWVEQLVRLCTDGPLRDRLAAEARATVLRERTMAATAESYLDLLYEVSS